MRVVYGSLGNWKKIVYDDGYFPAGYLSMCSSGEELLQVMREVSTERSSMTCFIARKVVLALRRNEPGPSTMDGVDQLSPWDREVLELLAQGFQMTVITRMPVIRVLGCRYTFRISSS